MFSNDFTQNLPQIFHCKNCDFKSCNKKDYTRHLQTKKHINCISQSEVKFFPKKTQYDCSCGKIYNDNSGLWRHKKKCLISQNNITELTKKEDVEILVQYLIKENAEFKQLIIDQNKQMLHLAQNAGSNNNNNINNNNTTNNNSFNLNFFLNETCKNAMNIMDFVNQLQVGIKDLEETGRLGFADGISKIFVNGLKEIDISDRPIHCSDSKRETLYIKNNDQWLKESEDKAVLTNAIKHVAHKNMKQISEWTKIHPEYNDSESRQNDKYLKIVSESMSGSSQEETNKNYTKIIKNIVKETVIEK